VRILFFAQSRIATGCGECVLYSNDVITQAELWTMLVNLHPALVSLQKAARLARGETYLQDDELLQPDDEIAIIPPVSGG